MKIFQVDSFTIEKFKGNPAGVCLLDRTMPDEWMQSIAAELNNPETAFLQKEGSAYRLRWMTPTVEVDLCGHATLAAAHVLYTEKIVSKNSGIEFLSRSGLLTAALVDSKIVLDFPAESAMPREMPSEITELFGEEVLSCAANRFDYQIELSSEDAVRNAKPDMNLLRRLGMRGVVITSKATESKAAEGMDYDFISRCFYPNAGIDEDPVTGSAHCMLGPFWSKRLNKTELVGYQASKRGGYVGVVVQNDGRVLLKGDAVTVWSGEIS
jgi:PhzF family phenazine biosynthesis protein